MTNLIIFAPIAKREAIFYLNIAKQIKKQDENIDIKFISFFQPYNQIIEDSGFEVFDIYKNLSNKNNYNVIEYENRFNIDNINKKTIHEKVTFGAYNSKKLQNKFCQYLQTLDKYLISLMSKYTNISVYQELGGFIAPLSLYYASRKNNIEHIFFEPAFFKGRLHFAKNSLEPIEIKEIGSKVLPEVEKYLKNSLLNKEVVIPDKDKHHFKDMGISKIFNNANIKKIYEKLYYKYIKKQRQEYEHIGNHISRYLKMFINRKRSGKLYSKFDSNMEEKFIYFPFHVQLDYSLTIRSLEYLNQLALVEYVAQLLPANINLLIKEHPASIGGFEYSRLKVILTKYDNVKLIFPTENSYNIINKSIGILTINSKTGAEALVSGKEVIVLGSAFYKDFKNVHKVDKLNKLELAINNTINRKYRNEYNHDYLFNDIWIKSHPIELYKNDIDNINKVTRAILNENI